MPFQGFAKVKNEVAQRPGVKNPAALAAFIGRKKYGKKKFQFAAAKGKSLKGADAIARRFGKNA